MLADLTPRDLTDARAAVGRTPVEEVIDLGLCPVTETEWLQLMARLYGLPEHRPAAPIIPMLEKRK